MRCVAVLLGIEEGEAGEQRGVTVNNDMHYVTFALLGEITRQSKPVIEWD